MKAQRRDKRKETKKRKIDEYQSMNNHNESADDDMAALMGFSGFGTSKK